jgi:hypothetical protein
VSRANDAISLLDPPVLFFLFWLVVALVIAVRAKVRP